MPGVTLAIGLSVAASEAVSGAVWPRAGLPHMLAPSRLNALMGEAVSGESPLLATGESNGLCVGEIGQQGWDFGLSSMAAEGVSSKGGAAASTAAAPSRAELALPDNTAAAPAAAVSQLLVAVAGVLGGAAGKPPIVCTLPAAATQPSCTGLNWSSVLPEARDWLSSVAAAGTSLEGGVAGSSSAEASLAGATAVCPHSASAAASSAAAVLLREVGVLGGAAGALAAGGASRTAAPPSPGAAGLVELPSAGRGTKAASAVAPAAVLYGASEDANSVGLPSPLHVGEPARAMVLRLPSSVGALRKLAGLMGGVGARASLQRSDWGVSATKLHSAGREPERRSRRGGQNAVVATYMPFSEQSAKNIF